MGLFTRAQTGIGLTMAVALLGCQTLGERLRRRMGGTPQVLQRLYNVLKNGCGPAGNAGLGPILAGALTPKEDPRGLSTVV